MTSISFERDGWIEHVLDEPDEDATFTRLRISIGSAQLTRNYNKRGGGESTAINVPLLPLAVHVAAAWWPLLYEPLRRSDDERFQARHRLDTAMHGYVFPALAICSAGDEAVLADWRLREDEHSPMEFLTPSPDEPVQLARADVESSLMDFVEATLARAKSSSAAATQLRSNWNRIEETLSIPGQLAYCVAAGRLGLDPYDPDAPDISKFTADLDPQLFNDISDVVEVEELSDVTDWTRHAASRLDACPEIHVEAFGPPPSDDLQAQPWMIGSTAAEQLARKLGLSDKPKKAVGELLGSAVSRERNLSKRGPSSLTALVRRVNGDAHIGAIAQSSRQQRFRACAAAYLGWVTNPGDARAGTVALTRRQQASRAFAAEMLAPRSFLREQARPFGFTAEDIEEQASQLICPHETVLWQALRAGIQLRGIELPLSDRVGLFGSEVRKPA